MTAVWLSDHHCRDFNSEISAIFPEFFCFDKKYVSVVYMYVSNGPIGLSSSYSRAKHLHRTDSLILIISLLTDLESWVGCPLELNCKR